MKTINFITTLSAGHQKKIIRWSKISLTLFLSVFIGTTVITIQRFLTLKSLKANQYTINQTTNAYAGMITKNETLKRQELAFKEKFAAISDWDNTTKQTTLLLQSIQQTVNNWGIIESLTLNNKKINLVLVSKQTSYAASIIKSLQSIDQIEHLTLVSLQPKKQKDKTVTYITLKGLLKL